MRAIRQAAVERGLGDGGEFRWRGGEVTRLEAFTDAVLAFAVTLLVVSLEVPDDYGDLLRTMLGFPAFAVCFALLVQIWYSHWRFFRWYGLQDGTTVVLNSILLFVVLFYVYPLKFLFTFVVAGIFGVGQGTAAVATREEGRDLLVIYGIGFAALFGVFLLLHLHALRKREALGLDDREVFDTVTWAQHFAIYPIVAAISIGIVLAFGPTASFWGGIAYGLIGPFAGLHGWRRGRARERAFGAAPRAG